MGAVEVGVTPLGEVDDGFGAGTPERRHPGAAVAYALSGEGPGSVCAARPVGLQPRNPRA